LDEYALEDFGKSEYQDSLIPTNLLTILMGFSILLFNQAIVFKDSQYRVISVICGTMVLITYMFYLSEYYTLIWQPIYSLPNDTLFFRLYGLIIGIIIISLMFNFPEYWYLYLQLLFWVMWWKKRRTMKLFREAFLNKYTNFASCKDKLWKAKYVLAKTFTKNFFKYGVIVNVIYSIILYLLFHYDSKFIIPNLGFAVTYFSLLTIAITILCLWLWIRKITSGLKYMVIKINEGDYKYFEQM
jgi:hypothetical protein